MFVMSCLFCALCGITGGSFPRISDRVPMFARSISLGMLVYPADSTASFASSSLPCFLTDRLKDSVCRYPGVLVFPAAIAISRISMIRSIGATSFGHTSTHLKHLVQSHIPPSVLFSSSSLSFRLSSRGSSTNLHALARAAGPIKFESTSSTVQSDTHAPHIMQFIAVRRLTIDSLLAMNSPCCGSDSVARYGFICRILSKNGSRETTRSLMICWLPIGSIVISSPCGDISTILDLQTSFASPLTLIAHDPHMDALHAHRSASVGSISSRM